MTTIKKVPGRFIIWQFTVYALAILFCLAANAQETMMGNDTTSQMEATDTAQEQAAPLLLLGYAGEISCISWSVGRYHTGAGPAMTQNLSF